MLSGKTQLLNVIVTVVSQLGSTTLAELYGHYIRATGGKLGKAATSLGYGKSTGVVQLLQSDPRLSVVKTPNTKGHKSWKISLRSGLGKRASFDLVDGHLQHLNLPLQKPNAFTL